MSNNTIEKKKPGRPPMGGIRKNSGTTRKKTDIEHPAVQKVFKSLKKVASNPDSQSIAELICNVMDTDIRGLIPGETIIRTQNSINTLQKINEDMVYSGGGIGLDDNLPSGLDIEEAKQIESKNVASMTDSIKKALPIPEIVDLDEKVIGEIDIIDEYADYDRNNKGVEYDNKKRKVVEEARVI